VGAADASGPGPPGRYGGATPAVDRRLTPARVTTTRRLHRANHRPHAAGTDAAPVTTDARRRSAQ